MNTKIFNLITKNLNQAFNLPKYAHISITKDTEIDKLPWTPARKIKFRENVLGPLELDSDFIGTLESIVNDLDTQYSHWFFSEVWKPQTDIYTFTGWDLVNEINSLNPNAVLDVGCGYNQFKGKIQNLTGIDPYNSHSDYQVDILEYASVPESYDVIMALGSINFNSKEDVDKRFASCVKLLKPNGKMFFRVNPGIQHDKGPWVDVFKWSFEVAYEFASKYRLHLETFKKDRNDRLYFVYSKSSN